MPPRRKSAEDQRVKKSREPSFDLEAFVAKAVAEGRATVTHARPIEQGPPEPQSEKEFQAEVMREFKRCGWLAYHTHDSRKSVAGFLDTLALRAGRLVVAELKVGGGELTAAQLTWLEEWRKVPGAEVFVWRPTDFPEIVRVLT